jgi:hypothetical protein
MVKLLVEDTPLGILLATLLQAIYTIPTDRSLPDICLRLLAILLPDTLETILGITIIISFFLREQAIGQFQVELPDLLRL